MPRGGVQGNKGGSGTRGNKGGAPSGSANNSSAEKKALREFEIGELLYRQGDSKGALSHFYDALKHNKKLGVAQGYIGVILASYREAGNLERSGDFGNIRMHLKEAALNGFDGARPALFRFLLIGEHGTETRYSPAAADFETIMESIEYVVSNMSPTTL